MKKLFFLAIFIYSALLLKAQKTLNEFLEASDQYLAFNAAADSAVKKMALSLYEKISVTNAISKKAKKNLNFESALSAKESLQSDLVYIRSLIKESKKLCRQVSANSFISIVMDQEFRAAKGDYSRKERKDIKKILNALCAKNANAIDNLQEFLSYLRNSELAARGRLGEVMQAYYSLTVF